MAQRMLVLLALVLVTMALGACGGSAPTAPAPAAAAPESSPTVDATVASAPTQQAASAALTMPCAELIPPDELARMLGAKASDLMETVRPGWTACSWFYTPKDAAQQAEFTAQAYTGDETLVKWRMDTTGGRLSGVTVNKLDGYGFEGYTWVLPESKLRAVQALQDGRYVFLRFPADNLALGDESRIADFLSVLFRRLQEKG